MTFVFLKSSRNHGNQTLSATDNTPFMCVYIYDMSHIALQSFLDKFQISVPKTDYSV